MAKKQKINKSQAVRDYAKAHPGATSGEIAAALNKKGIKITANYAANVKSQSKKAHKAKKAVVKKPVARFPASPATEEPEKTVKASATVTLEQVKAVALTVKTLGGSVRLYGLLALVKEVGGVKKFKDLLEAISGTETDEIPF
jgi:hypothetical protein